MSASHEAGFPDGRAVCAACSALCVRELALNTTPPVDSSIDTRRNAGVPLHASSGGSPQEMRVTLVHGYAKFRLPTQSVRGKFVFDDSGEPTLEKGDVQA